MCCGARRVVERRACGCTTWGGRVCLDMGVGVWCVHAGRWSAACDGGMVGQGVAVVASPRGCCCESSRCCLHVARVSGGAVYMCVWCAGVLAHVAVGGWVAKAYPGCLSTCCLHVAQGTYKTMSRAEVRAGLSGTPPTEGASAGAKWSPGVPWALPSAGPGWAADWDRTRRKPWLHPPRRRSSQ